jgi:2'-hydroxyisoflavone reductase
MKVLVIGGTQFMGRNLVNRLLELEYDVTVLNRGKTPWPFEGKVITRLKCDRLNDRKRFRELLCSKRNQFDVIVDFVAFSKSNVRDVVASSSCHYIFISTDSVHMACLPPNAQRLLKETDAVIPEKELSSELRKIRGSYQIRYGLEKLKAEQYLHKKAKDRYTCLRYVLSRKLFCFSS